MYIFFNRFKDLKKSKKEEEKIRIRSKDNSGFFFIQEGKKGEVVNRKENSVKKRNILRMEGNRSKKAFHSYSIPHFEGGGRESAYVT